MNMQYSLSINKLKLFNNFMNITLNSQSRTSKIVKASSPAPLNYPPSTSQREPTNLPFYNNCPTFVFGNCIGHSDRLDNSHSQILENYPESKTAFKKDTHMLRSTKLVDQQSNRKYKICLSLRQSQQKYSTPKKRTQPNRVETNSYSEQKQFRPLQNESQVKEKEANWPKKTINLKIKTEPMQEVKSNELNMHQLKESMKPSTNIMTPASKSLKQSNNSSAKKVQLTISNHFKSSIAQQKKQVHEKVSTNICTGRKIEQNFVSQQIFISQSFMTAKLNNIYGEKHYSFLQHPSSNIVHYNQIMANEAVWKRPEMLSYSQPNCEIIRKMEIPAQVKKKVTIKNTSILQNVEDQEEAEKTHPVGQSDKIDIRQKFMERRYIGDYANTIKTFNESQFKSEHESVVLEHGLPFQGSFPTFIINRGSIKECPRQSQLQIVRRQCSSFGEQQNSLQMGRDRYRQFVNQPIQQGSFDAERQG